MVLLPKAAIINFTGGLADITNLLVCFFVLGDCSKCTVLLRVIVSTHYIKYAF